jgi:hypothetical protein
MLLSMHRVGAQAMRWEVVAVALAFLTVAVSAHTCVNGTPHPVTLDCVMKRLDLNGDKCIAKTEVEHVLSKFTSWLQMAALSQINQDLKAIWAGDLNRDDKMCHEELAKSAHLVACDTWNRIDGLICRAY